MFKREVPVYYVVLIAFLCIAGGSILSFTVLVQQKNARSIASENNQAQLTESGIMGCDYSFPRLNGYRYVKPLLFAEQNCESEKYMPMKRQITEMIEQYTRQGIINSASVYVRDFNEGEWICYNGNERYALASLLKLPVLLSYLRMAEDKPGLLNQQLDYSKPELHNRKIFFPSSTIQLGRQYTYRQLLQFMIIHSDNDATKLLMDNLEATEFTKTFSDLGLEIPVHDSIIYQANVKDCSVFLKVLYNSSYLTPRNSEYATSLLTETDFKDGIVSGLPPGVKVAHKFGEAGDGTTFELHETAIVYMDKTPYLITVMTKGKDIKRLPAVIQSISSLVYNNMLNVVTASL